MNTRIDWERYAINLASAAATRSEDIYRQVGAVAFNSNKRVIGVAYNGTPSGYVMPEDLSRDRDKRRPYMIHAEMNLCSLFKAGEAKYVALTCSPCFDCFKNLLVHGVEEVYYPEGYPDENTIKLAQAYNSYIKLIKVK